MVATYIIRYSFFKLLIFGGRWVIIIFFFANCLPPSQCVTNLTMPAHCIVTATYDSRIICLKNTRFLHREATSVVFSAVIFFDEFAA